MNALTGRPLAIPDDRALASANLFDTVYLLHFDEPYPSGRRPQHYLGHAELGRLHRRLAEHRNGSSKARLTAVIAAAGIGFRVARTWTGGYELERSLKRRHRPSSLCPICRAAKAQGGQP